MTLLIFDWSGWDGVATGEVALSRESWRRDPDTYRVPWRHTFKVPGRAVVTATEVAGEVLRVRWEPDGQAARADYVIVPEGPNPDRADGGWLVHLLERVDKDTLDPLDDEAAVTAAEVLAKAAEAAGRAVSASSGVAESAARASSASDAAAGAAAAASVSASDAAASAEDAGAHATAAGTSADVAARSAREAGESAEAASSAVVAAESAATSAESSAATAAALSESAAAAAESSQGAADAAQDWAGRAERSASDAAGAAAEAAGSASSAVSASDALNADAREFGDRVRSGEFKGAAGPANVLSIGTVSTLPPGSKATASIVGDSPVQVLNLGLVEGPEGKASTVPGPPGAVATASDYLIVGPGRPDVPSTTAGTITGREPVGARYESTDEAGVGARTWRKRPGGAWVVTDGDTGWRNVGDLLISPWTTAAIPLLRLRRTTTAAYLHIQYNSRPVPSGAILVVPVGFRGRGGGINAGIASAAIIGHYNNTPIGNGATSYQNVNGNNTVYTNGASEGGASSLTWAAADDWPTFPLPGSPA